VGVQGTLELKGQDLWQTLIAKVFQQIATKPVSTSSVLWL